VVLLLAQTVKPIIRGKTGREIETGRDIGIEIIGIEITERGIETETEKETRTGTRIEIETKTVTVETKAERKMKRKKNDDENGPNNIQNAMDGSSEGVGGSLGLGMPGFGIPGFGVPGVPALGMAGLGLGIGLPGSFPGFPGSTPFGPGGGMLGASLPETPENKDFLQHHFEDFYEDVFEELSKFGEIEDMNVCDNTADHLVGNVYIKFRREEGASNAYNNLTGRFFAGRPLAPEYSPVTDFRDACCRQDERSECKYGGLCNFLHLKKVSRSILRRLYSDQRKRWHEDRDRHRDSGSHRYKSKDRHHGEDSDRHKRHKSRDKDKDKSKDKDKNKDKEKDKSKDPTSDSAASSSSSSSSRHKSRDERKEKDKNRDRERSSRDQPRERDRDDNIDLNDKNESEGDRNRKRNRSEEENQNDDEDRAHSPKRSSKRNTEDFDRPLDT